MKIQVLENTGTKMKFVIEGVNHAFVNAIRRTLAADVPKLAFEDITIYDNTSALFDEMLALRVGLVPVPTDLGALTPREACEACQGEGCPNCTVIYTLSKEGPCTVYSGDMVPADARTEMPDKGIPLTKLLEGQRVMLEAAAILGTMTQHAKWQLVVGPAYREYPVINIKPGPAIPPATQREMESTMPKGAIEIRDGKIHVLDVEKAWDYLWAVRDVYELDNVELTTDPKRFIFRFETDGSMSCADALQYALGTLVDKLEELEEKLPALMAPAQ